MRWALTLSGEHGEGLESRVRFEGIVEEFAGKLEANGYLCGGLSCSLDVKPPSIQLASSVSASESFRGTPPHLLALEDEELASLEEEEPDFELVEPTLGEQIAQLQAARGAGEHLSQREMAEILGVTRYQIKKALG